jgi:outer membrane protein
MKKIIFSLIALCMFAVNMHAQKFAFVDTEYILDRIPSYKSALAQIDKLSADYQKEIEAQVEVIEKLYKNFQNERVLLSEEQKIKKEEDIISKEKSLKELQQKYFGPEGAVFKKRQELVKPIQDDVYNAVKELAIAGGYAVIFDTASGSGIIYENPRNNISDEVLQKLGYK